MEELPGHVEHTATVDQQKEQIGTWEDGKARGSGFRVERFLVKKNVRILNLLIVVGPGMVEAFELVGHNV